MGGLCEKAPSYWKILLLLPGSSTVHRYTGAIISGDDGRMTDRCTQQPQSSASGLQPTIKSANDFRRNGFRLFFLVNFLFPISGRQEPRLVLSGQTRGSVRKCQILELSANKSGGSVIADATPDLRTRVFEIWGLFCCLSPASSSESSKEKLVEEASGTGLRG